MGKHIAVKLWANANIWHRENSVDCLWKNEDINDEVCAFSLATGYQRPFLTNVFIKNCC
jgi:hypothetical protein